MLYGRNLLISFDSATGMVFSDNFGLCNHLFRPRVRPNFWKYSLRAFHEFINRLLPGNRRQRRRIYFTAWVIKTQVAHEF